MASSLSIADGEISAVGTGHGRGSIEFDACNLLVLPGIVDLHGYGRGDQLIKIIVETPRSLTARQRELLEEFAKLDGKAVNHPLSKGFVDKLKEMFG